jgi:ABC-type transport system substrate-binding protein
MEGKRRMGHRRALVVAVVALLAVGLVWGLGSALAGSENPSPAAGKTVLRLGWTCDPDNLNPFIGYESSSYEIWALNYELLVGFRASDFANEDKGSWWYNTQPDSYVAVHPGAAVVETKSSNTGLIAALVLRTRSSGTAASSRGCGPRA